MSRSAAQPSLLTLGASRNNKNVVIEDESESDYVFVGDDIDLLLDNEVVNDDEFDIDIDWDERSYDHCDLSPSLSCATSVASNVTLKDLNLTTMTTNAMTSAISANNASMTDDPMDVDDDDGGDMGAIGSSSSSAIANNNADNYYFATTTINTKSSGRRLSNKKLRKKMKNMKKAAAARALEEQKAATAATAAAAATNATTTTVNGMSSSSSSSSDEDQCKMQQKKPRAVSIDCT